MDDAKVEEVKASGKSLEDCLDDLILDEKAKPHPNPLNVMWVVRQAFGVHLGVAKLLVKSPERIRALRASLGP